MGQRTNAPALRGLSAIILGAGADSENFLFWVDWGRLLWTKTKNENEVLEVLEVLIEMPRQHGFYEDWKQKRNETNYIQLYLF